MAKKITYKSSGVDIEKANSFVRSIKNVMGTASDAAVLKRKGSFGCLYNLGTKVKDPVLVSSTDGVGTKLLIAQKCNKHDTVGIDLVAMNVNDILCVGAQPLFFLDYIACGSLKPGVLKNVVSGIVKGCQLSGCSLIGGETAEMPGMYKADEYDLAGFAVGVVSKKGIIDGAAIKKGDIVLGIPSSGLHSNGFSLVRKVFSVAQQKELAKELLRPTRIYAKEIQALTAAVKLKGIAHLTGGAFYDKLTKVLPTGMCAAVSAGSWPIPKIFKMIQKKGMIDDAEMHKTFNMGIGIALYLSSKEVPKAQKVLEKLGMPSWIIGSVITGKRNKVVFT